MRFHTSAVLAAVVLIVARLWTCYGGEHGGRRRRAARLSVSEVVAPVPVDSALFGALVTFRRMQQQGQQPSRAGGEFETMAATKRARLPGTSQSYEWFVPVAEHTPTPTQPPSTLAPTASPTVPSSSSSSPSDPTATESPPDGGNSSNSTTSEPIDGGLGLIANTPEPSYTVANAEAQGYGTPTSSHEDVVTAAIFVSAILGFGIMSYAMFASLRWVRHEEGVDPRDFEGYDSDDSL